MAKKAHVSETPATAWLKAHGVAFTEHPYDYLEHGGAQHSARVLGLDRGTLRVGAPGDVTVFDTESRWTYDVNKTLSKSKNSPFHGREFRGGPVASVAGGNVIWQAD